jgi:flavin reductase (DIM6/NTAB) family NADH-FMN oxidoreductase RutF
MFYRPEDGHGLPHNPFTAIVAPRPIGWISTRGSQGDNLAPYSFFNAVAYDPPQVMFASTGAKHSWANAAESGVFAANIVEAASFDLMNASSAQLPRGEDEFLASGTPKGECATIDCPRVQGAPATLECRVARILTLEGQGNYVVIGRVTGVHLRDDCLSEGRFDITRFRPIARAGYHDYAVIEALFARERPGGG